MVLDVEVLHQLRYLRIDSYLKASSRRSQEDCPFMLTNASHLSVVGGDVSYMSPWQDPAHNVYIGILSRSFIVLGTYWLFKNGNTATGQHPWEPDGY